MQRLSLFAATLSALIGCGTQTSPLDAGTPVDAGSVDASFDATPDGGDELEADAGDELPEAGAPDGGEAVVDAGTPTHGSVAIGEACEVREDCVPGARCESGFCREFQPDPFCQACSIAPGTNFCGDSEAGPSHCLVDASRSFVSYFCGVGCVTDADCPTGAACDDVGVLTQALCSDDQPCAPTVTCATDAECRGGSCEAGRCRPPCVRPSGSLGGFCGCVADDECPTDTCDAFTGRCAVTGVACDPSSAVPCAPIACVGAADGTGYCRVGRNCAPAGGLTCDDLR